jgi:uncharacterized sulfatase
MSKQVILFMTDTQRKDMVGAYGNPDVQTPNLDRLAEQGLQFEHCYTTNPVCGPARSSLFTGLYPHSNGSFANGIAPSQHIKHIGERLTDAKIPTGYIGKWHLDGGDYFGKGIAPNGWDSTVWYDMRNYLDELTDSERIMVRNQASVLDGLDETITFAHRCSNRAIDYIKEHKNEDFFLVVSYDEPHHPYICPKPFYDQFVSYEHPKSKNCFDSLTDKPAHQQLWADQLGINKEDPLIDPYWFGCNSYVDYEMGRVFNTIEDHLRSPLILYTSDHGGAFHSHRLNDKGPAMYEEITNVPFLVYHPDIKNQNLRDDLVVSHIDIAPTILEYFDVSIPKSLQGTSLLDSMFSEEQKDPTPRFMEYTRYEVDHDGFGGYQPIRSVVTSTHKLVINILTTDELYDLSNDTEELTNLIHDPSYQTIRNELHDQLLDWMYETRDPWRGYYWYHRPWRIDASPASWRDRGFTRQPVEEVDEPHPLDYATGLPINEYTRKK